MHRFFNAKAFLVAAGLLVPLGLAASCRVDTDGLVFQDRGAGGDNGGLGGLGNVGCEHEETGCDGKQAQICAGGDWYAVGPPCEYACVAGLCVGSCDPTSTQCVSSAAQQTCSDVGMWGAEQECEYACVDDGCSGVCSPGEMRCDDQMPQRCDDAGEWQNERDEDCPAASCEDGKCTSCNDPEDTQCASSTTEQSCDGAAWGPPGDCDFVCFGGSCTGVCHPGSAQCPTNTHRQVCGANGQWGTPASCGSQACVGDTCVGVCRPGTTRCHNSGASVQTCNDVGQWVNTEACSDDTPVCATAQGESFCALCQPGSRRCADQRPEWCSAEGEKWIAADSTCGEAFPTKPVCYQGSCYGPKEVCTLFTDPVGCASSNERWFCPKDTAEVQDCGLLETCVDGVCGRL